MRPPRRLFAALAAIALASASAIAPARPAAAQEAATLVADRVEIRADNLLVAEGNVEVFWRGSRLRATRIAFDRAADRLTIEGPIILTEGERVAIFADAAELSADLREGLLTGARLVLDQQLQFAAARIARSAGRYTELDRVVASSCRICADRPVPLWSIRARRVVHDQQARQIHFEGAQFRIADVPVVYIPRLRFPDPTLKRATGFLFPTIRSNSSLGTGVRIPYFLTIGPHADLTLTPYLATGTTTLEARYRRAFRTGDLELLGAVSRDDVLPGETRAYLFGTGAFVLPRDVRLSFGIEAATDDAYLSDYGYGSQDRLHSHLGVSRFRRGEAVEARLHAFRTLRDGESNATLPTIVGEARLERRFVPGALGGTATLSLEALTGYRSADLDAAGRDVTRAGATLAWERTEVLGPGLLATLSAGLRAQYVTVADDAAFPDPVARLIPEAGVTLRWPLARATAGGATHVLEPVAMLAWSPADPEPVPNEDSTIAELDEANLLSFTRLPGEDGVEQGLRLALGLGWTRFDPSGWTLAVTAARILREDDDPAFGPGTGLQGDASDWLVAARLDLPNRLRLAGRALFDDGFGVTRADVTFGYATPDLSVETGLTRLLAAPGEGRPDDVTEWLFDADWSFARNWRGHADWRYDFEAERATRAGLGLGWRNECLSVDLSLSRRFSSSTSVRPTTNFGLEVELIGFGSGGEGGAARRGCVN
ncbi:MAG: LPS assembly protein LptD [Rhodobacteraceae bacterium]|nr:LPS assembly protein LptD [Paracoccaceae bacterium]